MLFKQFLNRFSPLLLGYDIFISYRRTDAGEYAEKLAAALQEKGFICFLDREETVAGIKLSPALNKALRRSHTLVVILTPGVLKSDWVELEVETFLRKPNRLVPINVDKFLFREDVDSTIFAQLRALSWLDESKESLQSGNPRLSLIQDIQKSQQRWLRIRTIMRLLILIVVTVLAAGGYSFGTFFFEEQRHAQAAYKDIRQNIEDIRVLLRFMVFASQGYRSDSLGLPFTREESFEAFKTLEVVTALEKLDFASVRLNYGPFIGFQPISNPGDRRSTVSIVTAGAQRILSGIGQIKQQRLPLANKEVLELVDQLKTDAFLNSLVNAKEQMLRYHEIEDSDRMPYFMIGNPGVSSKQQYLDFLGNVERLRNLL